MIQFKQLIEQTSNEVSGLKQTFYSVNRSEPLLSSQMTPLLNCESFSNYV